MHENYESIIWHERFGHFKYMQKPSKHGMVKGFPGIEFSHEVCEGCALIKHLHEKFEKAHAWRVSSPLGLVHSHIKGISRSFHKKI